MIARTVIAGLIALAGALGAGAPPAAAQTPPSDRASWPQAAGQAHYPVYRPRHTLGLRATVQTFICDEVPGNWAVSASYTRPGRHQRFGLFEGSPYVCGNAGEAKAVTTARIHGQRVHILVFCGSLHCDVGRRDGRRYGWLLIFRPRNHGHRRTMVQLTGSGMRLRAFLRVARSLTRVHAPARTRYASSFRSPDGRTWCILSADPPPYDRAWCVNEPGYPEPFPQHAAEVHRDGAVASCTGTGPADACTQNWDVRAPVLRVGWRDELYGFRCVSRQDGITCTVIRGPGRGHGFRIGAAGIAEI